MRCLIDKWKKWTSLRHVNFLRVPAYLLITVGGALIQPVFSADLIFNTQEFRPFNYTKGGRLSGKVEGPAADIVRAICDRAELDCVLRARPWRRAILEVKKGVAQGLFVIGWNKPRAEWLHFSPPLLTTEYGFFIRTADQKSLRRLVDFNGARVAVFGPSNTSYSLEKLRDTTLSETTIDMAPDDPAGFKKLAAHRVTSVYSNRDVGNAIIAEHRIVGLSYGLAHRKLNYFVGLSKQYSPPAMWEKFNSAAIQLHREKVVHHILDRYNMMAAELRLNRRLQPGLAGR